MGSCASLYPPEIRRKWGDDSQHDGVANGGQADDYFYAAISAIFWTIPEFPIWSGYAMRHFLLALTVPLAFVSSIAAAEEKAEKPAAPDPNRIICKSIKQLGSMTRTNKVCQSARDWADLRQRSREATEEKQFTSGE
jgi:hypothetical protein